MLQLIVRKKSVAPENPATAPAAPVMIVRKAAGKYAHIDFAPPAGVKSACANGITRHAKGETGKGMKPDVLVTAKAMSEGQPLAPTAARQLKAWHGVNAHLTKCEVGTPGYTSHQLRGGPAGKSFATRLVKQMATADAKFSKKGIPDDMSEGMMTESMLPECPHCSTHEQVKQVDGDAHLYTCAMCSKGFQAVPDTSDDEDATDAANPMEQARPGAPEEFPPGAGGDTTPKVETKEPAETKGADAATVVVPEK